MSFITLTSDLGDSSHYPAVIKGVILSLFPDARIIDATHNIAKYDLMEAAYVVKSLFRAYPAGSIHVVAVDPEEGDTPAGVVMEYDGHYFVGPNNGVMNLICGGTCEACVDIKHPGLMKPHYPRSFRAGRYFAPAAAFLASGGQLEEIGEPVTLRDLRWGEPSYSNGCLRGKIIHIDRFGNAITNIHKENFLEIREGRSFQIFVRNVRLRRIVTTYSDVPKTDALAIFGESGHIEIALRESSAAELLGLKLHDMITIEFQSS